MVRVPRPWGRLATAVLGSAIAAVALAPGAAADTHIFVNGIIIEVNGGAFERQNTLIAGPNRTNGTPGVYQFEEVGPPGSPHEDAGNGCSNRSPILVECTAPGIGHIDVDAFALDDKVTVVGGIPQGVDVDMIGSAGDDVLRGGAEEDIFESATEFDGADQYYGGNGLDTIKYSGRTKPVTVVLDDHSNDGATGENDFVSGDIENVTGGHGDDDLVGNNAENILKGGEGNDLLVGGGGSDKLIGQLGNDDLHDDLDRLPDTFECDDGFDKAFGDLVDAKTTGIVFTGCEQVFFAAIDQHPNVVIKVGGTVTLDRHARIHLPLVCPRAQHHGCHNGHLSLARGRHVLGTAPYSLDPGGRTTITFQLSRTDAGKTLTATAREKDPERRPKTTKASFHLRA